MWYEAGVQTYYSTFEYPVVSTPFVEKRTILSSLNSVAWGLHLILSNEFFILLS